MLYSLLFKSICNILNNPRLLFNPLILLRNQAKTEHKKSKNTLLKIRFFVSDALLSSLNFTPLKFTGKINSQKLLKRIDNIYKIVFLSYINSVSYALKMSHLAHYGTKKGEAIQSRSTLHKI